jgi:hypothetical protein
MPPHPMHCGDEGPPKPTHQNDDDRDGERYTDLAQQETQESPVALGLHTGDSGVGGSFISQVAE